MDLHISIWLRRDHGVHSRLSTWEEQWPTAPDKLSCRDVLEEKLESGIANIEFEPGIAIVHLDCRERDLQWMDLFRLDETDDGFDISNSLFESHSTSVVHWPPKAFKQ